MAPWRWTLCVGLMSATSLGCGSGTTTPPPDRPEPEMVELSAEFCAGFGREQDCLEAGCSIFTSARVLETLATGCELTSSRGVCLLTRQGDSDAALITYYSRTDSEGVRETLSLGSDLVVEGWQRCGFEELPPDCDCDGVADVDAGADMN